MLQSANGLLWQLYLTQLQRASISADYDDLPLEQRVAMLCSLCHLAMDSPSIRCVLCGCLS